MTKISNQYSLTNILTADLANSRLGINNVSPTVALDVTGAGKFSGALTAGGKIFTSTSVNDNIIELINSDTTNGYGLYVRAGGTASGRYVARFKNGADADVMWLDKGGNVGIGTITPTARLEVYGGESGMGQFTLAGTYGGIMRFAGSGVNKWAISVESGLGSDKFGIFSYWASAYVAVITTAGNVGIGTSSPQGGGGATDRNLSINSGAGAASFVTGLVGDVKYSTLFTSNSIFVLETNAAIPLAFNTNSTERMRITSGGNVNIGRTADNTGTGTTIYSGGQIYVTTNGSQSMLLTRTSSDGKILIFYKDASEVGSISTNTYSLPSDLNFKKNINNLNLGLNLVDKLRPVSYNHKIDDEGSALSTGFIAQELEQSLTELGVNKNEYYILQNTPNEDKSQSQYWLDYTKLVPVLVKAIQELSAEINLLKNK
jgi:hypothetical protein